jgi:class 3 adenylate cyclase
MEEISEFINRITRLANRNQQLNSQLQELVSRYQSIEAQNNRYQSLLSEYAPEEGELKATGKRHLKRFPMVSLIYATFRGFKGLNTHVHAEELIDTLDELHLQIGQIAAKHNLMKIKTIGDSFLFVGGMLEEDRTNPIDVILAAREMQELVRNSCLELNNGKPFWKLSVGIHTGSVTAELTGKKKSPYNLLGNTVKIAYRLGRICTTDQLNISVMTFEMVKEFFNTEMFGHLPVKYRGAIDFYQLKSIYSELSENKEGLVPNYEFRIKYGLIQFMDIQERLLDKLEQQLPKNLYYHSVKHTIDVVTEVELIGWAEGLTEEEVLLLKLAALFHDSGHIVSYKGHEHYSTVFAREMLEGYNYTEEQIETVCRLIMATQFPPKPKDKLEEVICDSDLDYLGRSDFLPVSNTLFREMKEFELIDTYDNWNRLQLNFIRNHQYYTKTARNLREVNKQSQIDRLMHLLQHDEDLVGFS